MSQNVYFIIAAVGCFGASLLHLMIIAGGPAWYRYFGAGEGIARMAEAGHWYPPVITAAIASVLAVWGLYALSGAGVIFRLPLLKSVLALICAVFLLRGMAILPPLRFNAELTNTFWLVTSAISLIIGLAFLLGLRRIWSTS